MKKKYEIRLSKGAVRDLKKMEPALRDFLYNRIHEIAENPYKNDKLSGSYNLNSLPMIPYTIRGKLQHL
jgi:mRNA-degrading endonuclease RelE of RelBE toxin-antitoxin system